MDSLNGAFKSKYIFNKKFTHLLKSGKKLISTVSKLAAILITGLSLITPLASHENSTFTLLSDSSGSFSPDQDDDESLLTLLKRERLEQAKKVQILKNELSSTRERLEQVKADLMVRGYSTERVLKQKVEALEASLDKSQKEASALSIELKAKQEALDLKRKELENATTVFLDNIKRQSDELEQYDESLKGEKAKSRTLTHELSTLKATLDEKQELLDRMTVFEKEVRQGALKIAALEETLQNTYKSLLTERDDNQSLKGVYQSEKETREDLEKEIAVLKEKLAAENHYAESLVEALEKLSEKQKSEASQLGGALFDLTVRLYQEELQGEILKEKLAAAHLSLKDMDEEKSYLERKIEWEQQTAVASHQDQLTDLENQLVMAKKRVEELETLNNEMISSHHLVQTEEEKNQQIEELEKRLYKAESNAADLEDSLYQANTLSSTEHELLMDDLEEHKKALEETKVQIEKLTQELKEQTDSHYEKDELLKKSEEHTLELNQKLSEMEQNFSTLYSFIAEKDAGLESLRTIAMAQETDYFEKFDALFNQLEHESQEKESLRQSLEELENAKVDNEHRIQALELKLEQALRNQENEQEESQNMMARLSAAEARALWLEQKHQELLASYDDAANRLNEETKYKESLREELDFLSQDKNTLSQKEISLKNELNDLLQKQEEQELKAKQTLGELEQALQEQEAEKKKNAELLAKIQEFALKQEDERSQADTLVMQLTNAKAMWEQEQAKNEELLAKIQQYALEQENEHSQTEDLDLQLKDVKEKWEQEQAKADTLTKLLHESMEEKEELLAAAENLINHTARLEGATANAVHYKEDLENRLRQIHGEHERVKQQAEGLSQELWSSSEMLKHAHAKAAALEEKLEKTIAETETIKLNSESLHSELNDVSGQKEELENTIQGLRSEHEKLNEEITRLRQHLDEEEENNTSLKEEIEKLKMQERVPHEEKPEHQQQEFTMLLRKLPELDDRRPVKQ